MFVVPRIAACQLHNAAAVILADVSSAEMEAAAVEGFVAHAIGTFSIAS
jgi:hypothetical protein